MRAFGKPHVASKFIETFERPSYWQRRGEEKTFNDQKEEEFSKGIYVWWFQKEFILKETLQKYLWSIKNVIYNNNKYCRNSFFGIDNMIYFTQIIPSSLN